MKVQSDISVREAFGTKRAVQRILRNRPAVDRLPASASKLPKGLFRAQAAGQD